MEISSRTVDELLQWGRQTLQKASIDRSWVDARLLLAFALNQTRENLMANPDRKIGTRDAKNYAHFIHRRCQHEPVSRILGQREFWSLLFEISPATLDPRSDSETLIESVIKDYPVLDKDIRVLDLGTGSGCLILSLLKEYLSAKGVGVDINFEALKVARRNAENLGLQNRIEWIQGSWAKGLSGTFDIIVSNPPYISFDEIKKLSLDVKLYDPLKALDGGFKGLECYEQLASQLKPLCHDKTHLYLEIGQGQEHDVSAIMKHRGFQCQRWQADLSGIVRCGVFTL